MWTAGIPDGNSNSAPGNVLSVVPGPDQRCSLVPVPGTAPLLSLGDHAPDFQILLTKEENGNVSVSKQNSGGLLALDFSGSLMNKGPTLEGLGFLYFIIRPGAAKTQAYIISDDSVGKNEEVYVVQVEGDREFEPEASTFDGRQKY